MENELELKWRRIQQAMRQEEADGCLLTMNMNLYYVSGQVFNGYFYLPAEGRPYWFVKRLTVPETNQVHVIRKPEQMPELFRDLNLAMPRKLLLEEDELSYNECIRLQHVFRAEATGNASALIRHIRMIKTPWEIEQMRISARRHEAVYREIPACYRPGMRDVELQIEIEKRMRMHGSLGKMFLSDVLKGLAPKYVMTDFFEKFRISPNEVMESVYNRPFPNRFLSTISYFLADYTNDDYVFNLITNNLRSFFTRNVCQYDYKNYPIRFVGSLANSYAAILREVAGEFGIGLDVIEETPMNGLIEFHSLNIEEP